MRTEWPLDSGPISKKANVFSLSKIFIEGISPGSLWLVGVMNGNMGKVTPDYLAEDAGGHCGTQK
jgi:hypothetical protein